MIIPRKPNETDEQYAKRVSATQSITGYLQPSKEWLDLVAEAKADEDEEDATDGDSGEV